MLLAVLLLSQTFTCVMGEMFCGAYKCGMYNGCAEVQANLEGDKDLEDLHDCPKGYHTAVNGICETYNWLGTIQWRKRCGENWWEKPRGSEQEVGMGGECSEESLKKGCKTVQRKFRTIMVPACDCSDVESSVGEMFCGAYKCGMYNGCAEVQANLDGDKDLEDLQDCPKGYHTAVNGICETYNWLGTIQWRKRCGENWWEKPRSGGSDAEDAVGQYTYSQQEMNCYRNGGEWAGTWCSYHDSNDAETAVVRPSTDVSSPFTYGFAAVGAGFLVFQSAKLILKKNQEHSPLV